MSMGLVVMATFVTMYCIFIFIQFKIFPNFSGNFPEWKNKYTGDFPPFLLNVTSPFPLPKASSKSPILEISLCPGAHFQVGWRRDRKSVV